MITQVYTEENNIQHLFCDAFSLRKKCPYLEFFWYVFPRIRTEYGDI